MISQALSLLLALLIGHALADYPLQGDFLSKGKNRFQPLDGVPWYWCLGAHALIHAGMVWLITGSPALAFIELVVHALIDDAKCAGDFGYDADQFLHFWWKLFYVAVLCVPVTAF